MKKIELLCVGKIKEKYINEGIEEYKKRISKFAAFSVTELSDCPIDKISSASESKEILAKMEGYTVLLDLKGKEVSSEELSARLDSAFISHSKVQFVIGGSRGVTDEVRQRADLSVRFGRVTFPHMLMRLITVEQIYRALTISEGLPYHK